MLHVEDVLALMATRLTDGSDSLRWVLPGEWYLSFATNVSERVEEGNSLSSEQSRIILKMAGRARAVLIQLGDVAEAEIDRLLMEPQHRRPPYRSTTIPREVRYLGDNKLGFRFKFNEVIYRQIKGMADQCDAASLYFNRDTRIWVVPVHRSSLCMIERIIDTHRFHVDDDTLAYLELCHNSANWPSTFAMDIETGVIVANITDNELLAGWATIVAGGMAV